MAEVWARDGVGDGMGVGGGLGDLMVGAIGGVMDWRGGCVVGCW